MGRWQCAGRLGSGVWCGGAGDKAQVLQCEVENSRTGAVDAMAVRRKGGHVRYPVEREPGGGNFLRKMGSGTWKEWEWLYQ